MPTLLKNSAAEGYQMGLGAHLSELNRTEAARQADLNRYDANQRSMIQNLVNSYSPDKKGTMDEQLVDPKTGEKMSVREMLRLADVAALESAKSNNFQQTDARGRIVAKGHREAIYPQNKKTYMNYNSGA